MATSPSARCDRQDFSPSRTRLPTWVPVDCTGTRHFGLAESYMPMQGCRPPDASLRAGCEGTGQSSAVIARGCGWVGDRVTLIKPGWVPETLLTVTALPSSVEGVVVLRVVG